MKRIEYRHRERSFCSGSSVKDLREGGVAVNKGGTAG